MVNEPAEPSSPDTSSLQNHPGCLITGGSAGIGLATAKQFASQGFNVMICGRDPKRLDSALDEIQVATTGASVLVTVECDLAGRGVRPSHCRSRH